MYAQLDSACWWAQAEYVTLRIRRGFNGRLPLYLCLGTVNGSARALPIVVANHVMFRLSIVHSSSTLIHLNLSAILFCCPCSLLHTRSTQESYTLIPHLWLRTSTDNRRSDAEAILVIVSLATITPAAIEQPHITATLRPEAVSKDYH